MIPTNELRIKNWVLCDGKPVQVQGIDPHRTSERHRGAIDIPDDILEGNTVGKWIDKIHPIPLTPDVLEKCGFEKTSYGVELIHERWAFFADGKGARLYFSASDDEYHRASKIIECLHQLQNLFFSLSGKELEYNP